MLVVTDANDSTSNDALAFDVITYDANDVLTTNDVDSTILYDATNEYALGNDVDAAVVNVLTHALSFIIKWVSTWNVKIIGFGAWLQSL